MFTVHINLWLSHVHFYKYSTIRIKHLMHMPLKIGPTRNREEKTNDKHYFYCTRAHRTVRHRKPQALGAHPKLASPPIERQNDYLYYWTDWWDNSAQTVFFLRTLQTMWCARSTCALINSMTCTMRREARECRTWRRATSRKHCLLLCGTHTTINTINWMTTSSCARLRAQTTGGPPVTELNSRSRGMETLYLWCFVLGATGVCSSRST